MSANAPVTLSALLHAPRWRPAWRALCGLLAGVVALFAFGPATPQLPLDGADKINHLLAFAALALTAALGTAGRWPTAVAAAGGLLAYGAFIEAVQALLPHRHGSLDDLAADALGIAIGLALAAAMRWRAAPPAHDGSGARDPGL